MTVMTHVKALQAGHSSQGTSEPITPVGEKSGHVTYHISEMIIACPRIVHLFLLIKYANISLGCSSMLRSAWKNFSN